jgi:hypothetical protein
MITNFSRYSKIFTLCVDSGGALSHSLPPSSLQSKTSVQSFNTSIFSSFSLRYWWVRELLVISGSLNFDKCGWIPSPDSPCTHSVSLGDPAEEIKSRTLKTESSEPRAKNLLKNFFFEKTKNCRIVWSTLSVQVPRSLRQHQAVETFKYLGFTKKLIFLCNTEIEAANFISIWQKNLSYWWVVLLT